MANARATKLVMQMTADQGSDLASQDWCSDRAAQRPYVENILYRRCGWSEYGRVPDHAYKPDGRLAETTMFYKRLTGAPAVPRA